MIHKFCQNGYYIVLDVASGAVHNVDEVAYDILDYFETKELPEIIDTLTGKHSRSDIEEAYAELSELLKNELLYSKDEYENFLPALDGRKPVIKALCMHIAHDCNLKCTYCFAGEGEYHNLGVRSLMSGETGKKAIDFLVANSGARRNLEIDFFGGEPTINFGVVKEIVEYARSIEAASGKNFRFTLTTNGVLLNNEMIEYVNKTMHNVVLSIDGRKETNDRMRKNAGGGGSYDLIVPKFLKLAESRNQTNYYVRGTFTRHNLDFASDVLHLADLGFKQISVEPVVGAPSLDYTLREEDLPLIFDEYDKLAVKLLEYEDRGKGFNFFHFMIDLTGGPCVIKRMVGCGAGTEYLSVTPDGDLYPCHQFTGLDGFKIGTVDDGLTAHELRKSFAGANVYSKPECRKCFARFYCSGGCAANAFMAQGGILKQYEIGCALQKKRLECALMLKVAAEEKD